MAIEAACISSIASSIAPISEVIAPRSNGVRKVLPDGAQDVADDVVRLMLALLDLGDMLLGSRAAVDQPLSAAAAATSVAAWASNMPKKSPVLGSRR